MICDCDFFGAELRVDHLALESVPGVFALLAQRHAPELYQCTKCERWYRVQHWVDKEIQFQEDCTCITRLSPEQAHALMPPT